MAGKKDDTLERALGLGEEVYGFIDNKSRIAYPITMPDFPQFMGNVGLISLTKLWHNFLDGAPNEHLTTIFNMVFKDDGAEKIMPFITAKNYPEIIKQILKMNGIEPNAESKNVEEV